jgi:putative SOS response-associated peptidase YedK
MASASSSWLAGACRDRLSAAARRSPTSVTLAARIGLDGWARNRCLVPATSFCEHADTKPLKTPIWFALPEERPLFAFAGLWASWRSTRDPKNTPVEGQHELFGFLTTEANAIVAPISASAPARLEPLESQARRR